MRKHNLKSYISVNNDVDYSKFGGWLIVFAVSVFAEIIVSVYNMIMLFVLQYANAGIVSIEAISALCALLILIIVRKRSYSMLYLIRILYLLCVWCSMIAALAYNSVFVEKTKILPYAAVLWAFYLFKSRRVKHYYYRLEEVKTNDELMKNHG